MTTGAAWSVVLPVKALGQAKSRLAPLPADVRAALALAFAADTLVAVRGCALVASVLVVTDDEAAVALAEMHGAEVVRPGRPGLNAAVSLGWSRLPDGPAAALTADLPALRADELAEALRQAALVGSAFVADADGTGTTMLTTQLLAGRGRVRPRFGLGSAAAHRRLGAVPVRGELARLRRDVDTSADLAAAWSLGVGVRTAAVLGGEPAAAP